MIQLEHAHKYYKTVENRRIILDDVSLTIPDGRSLAILGSNGAGKSTIIRLLAGVEALDSGRIRRTSRVSFPLGFSGTFHPKLTGAENVRFLARAYGQIERDVLSYVEDFAELGHYFHMPFETYSSGMRARLAFGACLAIEFDVYLIDEVTSVGDARFRARCLEAFGDRMDRSDVIMVSHEYGLVRSYCDAGAVLRNGVLELYDDLDEAIDKHSRNMQAS